MSQTASGLYATGYFYPVGIAGLLFGGYLAEFIRYIENIDNFSVCNYSEFCC